MMPIEVFGAGAVQTAYVSYASLDLTLGSIMLIWPTSYVDVPYTQNGVNYTTLAASMTVKTSEGNAHTLTLPDATQSSVGANFIITNIGASSFNLLKSDGSQLIQIPPDEEANAYWVQLTDNSTVDGTWQFVQFGAGTSAADASVLAGKGLVPLGATLNSNCITSIKNDAYTVRPADRASLLVWQSGTGTLTLPDIASVPAGFLVSFNNAGDGLLTLSGDASVNPFLHVDPETSMTLDIGQSLTLVTDGVQWWTLGFSQIKNSSLFLSGNVSDPSISFVDNKQTGFYLDQATPAVGISVNQTPVASFNGAGLRANALSLVQPLSIPSGGTGESAAEDALSALMPSAHQGDMVYFDGTNWVVLPHGDEGQVLIIQGGIPTWSNPA